MREEIFGPVAALIPFETEAEAIALANDTEYGLAASVWTNDLRRGHRVAQKMKRRNLLGQHVVHPRTAISLRRHGPVRHRT